VPAPPAPLGVPPGIPPGPPGEELGQAEVLLVALDAAPTDVLLPEEHAASAPPSTAAAASNALALLLTMTFRLLSRD
jgi:hypothetical protein